MSNPIPTDPADDFLPLMDLEPMRASDIQSGPLGVARVIIALFSRTGVRDPPPPPPRTTDKNENKDKDTNNQQDNSTKPRKKMQHVRLITIAASHYCEKVRWGLDMLEQAGAGDSRTNKEQSEFYYTEDGHPPAFGAFATVPASNDQASATPMIVFPDGRFLCQSDVILYEFCPFLYPTEISRQVVAFELDIGIRLAAAIRLCFYHRFLDPSSKEYYPALVDHLCLHSSRIEKILFRLMLDKGIDQGIRNAMQTSDENARKSKAMIRQVFAQVSNRLQQSGGRLDNSYLMDTGPTKYGFTAADLTFAATVYPILRPPEMSHFFADGMDEDRFPPDFLEFGRELRATVAGQHALNMYAQHRPVSFSSDGKVVMKSGGYRDRMPWKELGYLMGVVGAVTLAVVMAHQAGPGLKDKS
jgi:glutathione S-transferase